MYTIKQAAELTSVPAATLRAWERRYAAPNPSRNESGYRLYDKGDVADILGLRTLVEAGWAPVEAARAIHSGVVKPESATASELASFSWPDGQDTAAAEAFTAFLKAAATLDSRALDESLDRGFALGPFELVVEGWLFPTLTALGDGWARPRARVMSPGFGYRVPLS